MIHDAQPGKDAEKECKRTAGNSVSENVKNSVNCQKKDVRS